MVTCIEQYGDVLKVFISNRGSYLLDESYFYCDACMLDIILNAKSIGLCSDYDKGRGYRRAYLDGKPFTHYVIGFDNIPEGYVVDHISGVTYDNCRCNLRAVNKQTNSKNKSTGTGVVLKVNNDSVDFVVTKQKADREIYEKMIFDTELDALLKRSELDYNLRTKYSTPTYEFLRDRRRDRDLVDLVRMHIINEEDEKQMYISRYAGCAWYYYRFKDELESYKDLFNLDTHCNEDGFLCDSKNNIISLLIHKLDIIKPKFEISSKFDSIDTVNLRNNKFLVKPINVFGKSYEELEIESNAINKYVDYDEFNLF